MFTLFSLSEISVQHSLNPMPKQAGRDPEQLPEHGGARAIHRFAYQPATKTMPFRNSSALRAYNTGGCMDGKSSAAVIAGA
jgi:hypothetical protein